jgi:glyoxylate/hydroxypyruvate reductase
MTDSALLELTLALGAALRQRGERLATAESCTGGMIAGACTAVAGSSDWLDRGFVTYSNAAKTELLDVSADLLAQQGAVSQPVAEAMVQGALGRSQAQWAIAVTGIAGPGGAVPGKPVGTVWLAWGHRDRVDSKRLQLDGDRSEVRRQTVEQALAVLLMSVQNAQAEGQQRVDHASRPPTHAVLLGELEPAEMRDWMTALQSACQEDAIWLTEAQALSQADQVELAVVAQPRPGCLRPYRQLRLVQSLWAGVDRVIKDTTIPAQVPLARMVDPFMTRAMVETALWAVLSLHRGFFDYARSQRSGEWLPQAQVRASDCPVLVLGQGEMGKAVSTALRAQGYPVAGWRRSSAPLELDAALAQAHIVINLLPLTPQTRGLIQADRLALLPRGRASIVNLARGAHIVEEDLLAALDSGHVRHAVLDVFQQEPLPPTHPFWLHPKVTVLPHVAAMTDFASAAAVVAANLRRLRQGLPLEHLVDRARGY